MNNSPEVFVLKGDVAQGEHVHGAGCGCGHPGTAGPPAPERPKPVGFLAVMLQAQKAAKITLKPGRNTPKSVGPQGPIGPPKKKKRDWAAEIRQLRQAGDE